MRLDDNARFERAKGLFMAGLERAAREEWPGAEALFREALELMPDRISVLVNLAAVLLKQRKFDEAEPLVERARALEPEGADVLLNLAALRLGRQHYEEALEVSVRLVERDPGLVEAWMNKGRAEYALSRDEAAYASFLRAGELDPGSFDAWLWLGTMQMRRRQHVEALAAYERAEALKPGRDYVVGQALFIRQQLCDWRVLDASLERVVEGLRRGHKPIHPFPLLSLIDDPALHRRCAELHATEHAAVHRPLPPRAPDGRKLRVGYFSADFRDHAVSQLMAEVFERHDRTEFEWFGFAFGPPSDDAMRRRVSAAFDRFIDVRALDDEAVVRLARELEIDVAVDLTGYTQDGRPGLFVRRCAPVQIVYLGYPGTTGLPGMDYIAADPVVVPEEAFPHYSEKVIHLPGCYLPNDGGRRPGPRRFTRAGAGLPERGFVFCCFNNSYKIRPADFAAWMRILKAVDGAVLWLSDAPPAAVDNLRREAAGHGVDPGRLVFAPRMPELGDHLARLRLADLFLDTSPYNAHTTAIDALLANVPLLTCPGRSFASRVAASLLNDLGLHEWVVPDWEAYERTAVTLARDPAAHAALRERLARAQGAALFDGRRVARGLEAAYRAAHRRHVAGLPPDHLRIEAGGRLL